MNIVIPRSKRSLRWNNHSVLGKTAFCAIFMRKILLREYGHLWMAHRFKCIHFLTLNIYKMLEYLTLPSAAVIE